MFVNSVSCNNIYKVQNFKSAQAPLKKANLQILKDTVCFKGNEEAQKGAELLNRLGETSTQWCKYTKEDLETLAQKIEEEPYRIKVLEYILQDGRDKSGKVRVNGGSAIKMVNAATPENIEVLPVLLNAKNSKGHVLLNSIEVANIFTGVNGHSKEFVCFLLDAKNSKNQKRFNTPEITNILKNINEENAPMVEGIVNFEDRQNEGEYLLNSSDEIIGALKILPEIARLHRG